MKLYECAIGNIHGSMVFDRKGSSFSGRLVDTKSEAGGQDVIVEVRTIVEIINSGEKPPTLIKIDVEGGEGEVLESAWQTLVEDKPKVLYDMHPANPKGVDRAFSALSAADCAIRHLDGSEVSKAYTKGLNSYHILDIAE